MNNHDDDDDDAVDDRIFYQVMENDDNYDHLNDDMMLYEHPYKFQVLYKRKKDYENKLFRLITWCMCTLSYGIINT
jgi:hypothetical protein